MPSPSTYTTECLTIPEVAKELRIAKTSVYRLINKKLLKSIMVIGKKRVRRHELQRYLDLLDRVSLPGAGI